MDQGIITMDSEVIYPILFIPKRCTNLETNCEATDNVFIDVNITSPDTEGNSTSIYSGYCNVKLIDSYDVNIQNGPIEEIISSEEDLPLIITSPPPYTQSEVWIDPNRSPYVYNHCNEATSECYSICHQSQTSITVEQHNTYITKNILKEAIHYSSHNELDIKTVRKQSTQEINNYEDDEFECGLFLSQLPEEIMHEKKKRAKKERKYIGIQSDNSALKQLMSPGIQSTSKQRKTILFLGPDSESGQTIQQIAFCDPNIECSGDSSVDHEVIIDTEPTDQTPRHKKYQCAKCHQIFDVIADFRAHMVNHTSPKYSAAKSSSERGKFCCADCGKMMKDLSKFERHCLGHGDPELECNKCRKVFASKFTLRVHRKIHNRKHPCNLCPKSFSKLETLRTHVEKTHLIFKCDHCEFVTNTREEFFDHENVHESHKDDESRKDDESHKDDESYKDVETSETDFAEFFDDVLTESDHTPDDWTVTEVDDKREVNKFDEIKKADSVIATVMANKMFLGEGKKHRKYVKVCDVCLKSFDRISDLKRHLIEHIVRSTLDKNPVTRSGNLTLQCEVCQNETFTKIDKYKAHLREHAKLTLYKCTFCNKSFSDSSNFSKHKKIHGVTYFQCDLCQRKFNSKKMIARHMEYHNKNEPLYCKYCEKVFYFSSMLNKHVKSAHTKEALLRFRCTFCHSYFYTLKEKWDHEWLVHNVRKMIVDCLLCGAKFRKYSELKKHCSNVHKVEIPTAKKLLKKKRV